MIKSFKQFYKQRFRGQLFIIKAGGRTITDDKARKNLLETIQEFNKDGIKVLLIYGGGQAIDEALVASGINPLKIDGRRITSETDIAIIKKVLAGDLGFKISQTMSRLDVKGYVLGSLPAAWLLAKRKPKKEGITRFDGAVTSVYAKEIKNYFQNVRFAACPCLGLTSDGNTLNINADDVAVFLASQLKAAKLILLTDVDGVEINSKVASVLTAGELNDLIADRTITGGMRVKMESCIDALRAGVKRVHILNGFRKNALRNEVYTSTGSGTMIVRRKERKIYEVEVNPERKSA